MDFNKESFGVSQHIGQINLLVCIDSPVFVRGVVNFLEDNFRDQFNVCVHDPKSPLTLLGRDVPIILLDALAAPEVLEALPSDDRVRRVILVSEHEHLGLMPENQTNKVCAFYPARADESRLTRILRAVIECVRKGKPGEARCGSCPGHETLLAAQLPLSARELEVFELIGQLWATGDIAETLDISVKTLESHYSNIKRKLRLTSKQQLLKAAVDWTEGREPVPVIMRDFEP